MSKSNEPVLWLLFSAGGMISAMVFPMLLIITGVILPFELAGEVTFERIHNAVKNPVVKLVLFFVIALPFFHWAHRGSPNGCGRCRCGLGSVRRQSFLPDSQACPRRGGARCRH